MIIAECIMGCLVSAVGLPWLKQFRVECYVDKASAKEGSMLYLTIGFTRVCRSPQSSEFHA